MRLYIWEGDRISDAYHDDGTLVVLADSPEEARAIVRRDRDWETQQQATLTRKYEGWLDEQGIPHDGRYVSPRNPRYREARDYFDKVSDGHVSRYEDGYPFDRLGALVDGTDEALDREPDRVVELNVPIVVAFNGGGYD